MAEQIPEAWIGERVGLRYWRGDGRSTIACRLEAVNDRGVVAVIESDDAPLTRFYPWSAVLHIEPGVGEDSAGQGEVHSF